MFFLEHCRVLVKDGVPVYLCDDGSSLNIPVANTTVVILGTGTSITNAAVRLLASYGVLLGFCGNDGTPLFSGSEVEWILPQNEYCPTEWSQRWFSIWTDEERRLEAGKKLQLARTELIKQEWNRIPGFEDLSIQKYLARYENAFSNCSSTQVLLEKEEEMTDMLYSKAAGLYDIQFTRDPEGEDVVNRFLNHGNYLASGSAACALWVLGIPQSLAVVHGKTRRGGLVFDVADLVKDALVLPLAFSDANRGTTAGNFRKNCTGILLERKAMEYMFRTIETTALELT